MGSQICWLLSRPHSPVPFLDILWNLLRLYCNYCHQFPADRRTLPWISDRSASGHCLSLGATDLAVLHSESEVLGSRFDDCQHFHGSWSGHYVLLSGYRFAATKRSANDHKFIDVAAGFLLDHDICDGSDWRRYATGKRDEDAAEFRRNLWSVEQGNVGCDIGLYYARIFGLSAVW